MTTKELVLSFFNSFGTNGDWKSLIADDIVFNGPMNEAKNKQAFILLDLPFRKMVKSAKVKSIISEGNVVSALVNYEMCLPIGDTLNVEFSETIRVSKQKIKSINIFYYTAKIS